ncbi:hypothetical protein Bealeia1_00679 [Candidatus Bealeia paramacronuclearis]|uniref:Uncharacterized protein n=1 Tax=Candidatus Bealeia paramacronuclearis TaxID=1921001 RepID=A0ABZ2C409_9PROT|nr:hypothetical protein [Candidatus Bealeia paramacronuclearis]
MKTQDIKHAHNQRSLIGIKNDPYLQLDVTELTPNAARDAILSQV